MHTQSTHRVRSPAGLAFPVHELVFVRAWAQARGLALQVLLDQTLGRGECEEMLVVSATPSARGALRLWRMEGGGVVAQVQGGPPRVFGGIHSALSQAGAAFAARPVRAPWRRVLGWRRLPGQGAHAIGAAFGRWGIV